MSIDFGMREIPLINGGVALVDDSDYEELARYRWFRDKDGYAVRSVAKKVRMHREIAGAREGELVDHVNHSRADNRRSNLRKCSRAQNNQHRRAAQRRKDTGYKGVYLVRDRRRRDLGREPTWRAQITIDGRLRNIGSYATKEAAARAYDDAARRHFGEFALLNFP